MGVSRKHRKFNDPWGNKNYNTCGSPIRHQYMVAKSSLSSFGVAASLDRQSFCSDKIKNVEGPHSTFIRTSGHNVERLRK